MNEPAASAEVAVTAADLRKSYGKLVAVDGVDFQIERGECFGFLGPNGAGKTTTMRMIYRASPVGSGRLTVLGLDAASRRHDRAIKARLGVVPQEDNLDQDLTVVENLEVFCRFYGMGRQAASDRATELLSFVDLTDKRNNRIRELSGGMKRRLLVARGLINKPELLVLDEPTTGLDPRAREKLWEMMGELKERRSTLILTTHYMAEAERLCDRLVIMDGGKIVAEGSPRALIRDNVPAHVVEITTSEATPEAAITVVCAAADRSEVLRNRVLLYGSDAEAMLHVVTAELPDHAYLHRPASLEDVFLRLTGKRLDGAAS